MSEPGQTPDAVLRWGAIVEGHGEVTAVPVLLKRLIHQLAPERVVDVRPPHRVPRGKLVKDEELNRAGELVARQVGPGGSILVLLDADEDCPAKLGPHLLEIVQRTRPDRGWAVVLAKAEFEAWFLAAAASLAGQRGLEASLTAPDAPEAIRNAKGWLNARMAQGYSETIDQQAFARRMSLQAARAAPSFEKLVRDVARLLGRDIPLDLDGV